MIELPADTIVAAAPAFVSQKTSLQVLGIPPRPYLALLREPTVPPVIELGKLRLVETDAMVGWLRTQGRLRPSLPTVNDDPVTRALIAAGARAVR